MSLDEDDESEIGLNMAIDESSAVGLEMKENMLTVINTNARSLCPKLDSLINCFSEMAVDIGIVTETRMRDGDKFETLLSDLRQAAGIGSITKNRRANAETGVAHGGVGIFYRISSASFKKMDFDTLDFEVLPVVGSLAGSCRKIVVVGAYIPPNYTTARANDCMDMIVVIEARRRYRDPCILVAGDFNQWQVERALEEFVDIGEVRVGPTRGDREIDRMFCNFRTGMTESGTIPSLETEGEGQEVRRSDHLVAHMTTTLPHRRSFEWLSYSYRHCTEEAEKMGDHARLE